MKKLSDFCNVYSGYAFKEFNDSKNGKPVLKIGNINANGTIKLDNCQYSSEIVNEKYISQKNDLYIALSGATTGKVGIMNSDEQFYINQRVGIVRCKDDKIPVDYLKHYLISKTNKILSDASGCAQPNISPKMLDTYPIKDLKIDQMSEIACKLTKITDLIQKNKILLQKYDQLVKSQFIEMFGDVYSLQNNATHSIGDYVSDKTLKASKLDNTTDIKYIDISSINNQSNEITSYTEYDINERPSRAQQVVSKGDILISTVRPNLNNVAMVTDSFSNMVASTGFCVIKKNEKVNEYFIFTLVKNIEFANYLTKLTTGANYPAVNNKAILDFKIDLPPIELQNQFADFVKHIDKLKFTIKQSIEKLNLCYQSLMKEYFE